MKENARRQRCKLETVAAPAPTLTPKLKCLTVLIFEENGKTILQPLGTTHETQSIRDLFQSNTLEVWLSNGLSDPAQFDIQILKYKPQLQSSTACSKDKARVCLKNHFETIVSCDQCPLDENGGK